MTTKFKGRLRAHLVWVALAVPNLLRVVAHCAASAVLAVGYALSARVNAKSE
jgi:hypothetical protein